MDFDLTEEQRLLQESLARLLADRYGFEQRKGYMASPEGWSREMWSSYAELGLLGLPFSEEEGGFGGGAGRDAAGRRADGPRARARAVVPDHGARRRLPAPRRQRRRCARELAPKLIAGELLLAFAHTERQSRYDLHDVASTARRDGSAWVLDGRKGMVLHGDSADRLVVTARTGGERRDRRGIGVFVVDATAPGVNRRGYRTVDGQRAAEVELSGVRVETGAVLGDPADGLPLVERVVDEAIAALAAEAVGAMEVVHGMTLDYLKTRQQFGRPIGSFQALQHRAADMQVQLEQARSMAYYAAMSVGGAGRRRSAARPCPRSRCRSAARRASSASRRSSSTAASP